MLRAAGYLIVLPLVLCPIAKADVFATLATTDLGGGEFQYDFTIHNTSGTIPISGLLIEGGNSVFGLDPSSTIGAPAGWDFLSPLPPFDDLLSYFSLTPATDVPIGGSLSGFTFDSTADPGFVFPLEVILVGSDSSQIPYIITPDPATVWLLGTILIAIAIRRWRYRRQADCHLAGTTAPGNATTQCACLTRAR
jgi:hypothetical protein